MQSKDLQLTLDDLRRRELRRASSVYERWLEKSATLHEAIGNMRLGIDAEARSAWARPDITVGLRLALWEMPLLPLLLEASAPWTQLMLHAQPKSGLPTFGRTDRSHCVDLSQLARFMKRLDFLALPTLTRLGAGRATMARVAAQREALYRATVSAATAG